MGSYSGVVVQMWNANTSKEERGGPGAPGEPELNESWVEQKQNQKDDLVNIFAYFPHKIMKVLVCSANEAWKTHYMFKQN